MKDDVDQTTDVSPFHVGEMHIQERVGKRDTIENLGRRAIRSFMPQQHREFYTQLPFLVVGSVDQQGWPWASILSAKPGFIATPDATTLTVNAKAVVGDPLADIITLVGAPLGLLGIEIRNGAASP